MGDNNLPAPSAKVQQFLDELKNPEAPSGGRGRLIFALDATASREATWERACHIQGEMFEATTALGGLEIQLVFYRGVECKASKWMMMAADLHRVMSSVSCVGGMTQIERVFSHAIRETRARKVDALVFVGDAIEENVDQLCQLAGELGLLGVPIFLFHEGGLPHVAAAFKQMANLSHGAYLSFDLSSIDRLKELLGAVAVYVAGGHDALSAYGKKKGGDILRLTAQLRK
jgi:hypothetical protein